MLKTILIDDEVRAIKSMERLLEQYTSGIEVVARAQNKAEALEAITAHKPDLVFLDIEMPPISGFDILDALELIDFKIIFVTAYHEYALKAFRYAALDYLLKPVSPNELIQAISRLQGSGMQTAGQVELLREKMNRKTLDKIVLPYQDTFHFVKLSDIIYCRADDSYTHFYLANEDHFLVSRSLREYEEMLSEEHFYRVHKSYLINLQQVKSVHKKDGGLIRMSNGAEIPIASRKKEDFFDRIRHLR